MQWIHNFNAKFTDCKMLQSTFHSILTNLGQRQGPKISLVKWFIFSLRAVISPVGCTGPPPVGCTGSPPIGCTGSPPIGCTGPSPVGWTGPRPVGRTGPRPVDCTGQLPVCPHSGTNRWTNRARLQSLMKSDTDLPHLLETMLISRKKIQYVFISLLFRKSMRF